MCCGVHEKSRTSPSGVKARRHALHSWFCGSDSIRLACHLSMVCVGLSDSWHSFAGLAYPARYLVGMESMTSTQRREWDRHPDHIIV